MAQETKGENALILVAGAPTTVTNATIAGIIDEAGQGNHLLDIFGAPTGVGNLLDGKLIDLGAQKRKVIEGLRRTPGSVLAGRPRQLGDGDAATLIGTLRQREIGTIFLLGGLPAVKLLQFFNDAAPKANYPLSVLAVPLSSENEVEAGDHTPGYGSAARFAAGAARDAAFAASSGEEPLLVIEYLGAQCGWLAAATALGRDESRPAPHAILVPEKAVNLDQLVDELRRAYLKYDYAVVVTTQGAKATDGTPLDGANLLNILQERLNLAGRLDKPGSLAQTTQSALARADGDEAYNMGSLAVRLSEDGCSGYLMTVQRDPHADRGDKGYRSLEGTARLDQVPATPRLLPDNYLNEHGTNVTDAFTDWCRPLIGGALPEYTSLG
jgi:6-phosphofructokinase 1